MAALGNGYPPLRAARIGFEEIVVALTALAIMALAGQCAPSVAPETLLAVARVESGLDPLAIGVNGAHRRRISPPDKPTAIRLATQLVAAGRNIDLGLGQINSRTLGRLGMSMADAFDPCRNLAGAASVVASGYLRAGPSPGAEQAALRTSLSLYNTGDPVRGFRNGYVAKVLAAAGDDPAPMLVAAELPATRPASWDVFAQAAAPAAGFVFTSISGDGR